MLTGMYVYKLDNQQSRVSGCLILVAISPPLVWVGCHPGIYVLRHPSYPPLWYTCSVSRMLHFSGGSVSSGLSLRFPRLHHAPISDQSESHSYCIAFLRRLWYDHSSTRCWSTRIPIFVYKRNNLPSHHSFIDKLAFRPTGSPSENKLSY